MIVALMPDGSERAVSSHYGATVDDVIASLTANTLTGSAVPLANVMVKLADGGAVAYFDIQRLVDRNP